MSETIETVASLPTSVEELRAMILDLQTKVSLGVQVSSRTNAERLAAANEYAEKRQRNEGGYNDDSRIYPTVAINPKQIKASGPTKGWYRFQIWTDNPGITFREYKAKLALIKEQHEAAIDMTYNLKRGLIRVEN